MSGLQRYCIHHGDWVDHNQAAMVPGTDSGPGLPEWACYGCVPAQPEAFIGRRDAAPVPPGEGAA